MDESRKHEHEDEQEKYTKSTLHFLERLGRSIKPPDISNSVDFLSELINSLFKVEHISRGHVTCSFSVKPSVANSFRGLHGGAVAAIAKRLATASARTIVAEVKPLFLGEMSISYLSAAPINTKLIADGTVLRSGRNLTVASIEIRLQETKKLLYTAQPKNTPRSSGSGLPLARFNLTNSILEQLSIPSSSAPSLRI